ncbi:bifunctional 3-(3-hydroxy-phenyl)propionate/3-hydroxycinnamic acid hydroxylase [Aquihabitans sp. McL0605]|uniref:bifunctional 3-(3-hydroxy-phenyl)propionate/3-hydroxycinnamic acid hydroxylase MhpA n=1 Tax=Aquihabitans sp. McL0605 TaxID=3415671 RepID=UPI003CF49AF4
MLATLLGRQGHRVLVVERHREPYQLPHAVHFDHEIARILQACGLGDQLATISEACDTYEWRNAAGQVLLRFGGRPVGPSGWPDMNMFWQPALEALIEEAAHAQPSVEVRRGTSVAGLDDHGDEAGVSLTLAADLGGAEHQAYARYVVGCDGANSTVRDLVGISVTDLGFFYDWLIVDLAFHEPREFVPMNVQICDPVRPTTVVSGGPGRRRWEFMRLPHETVAELDDRDRAWKLLEPWAITPADATLERHAVYRFQARWAEHWHAGNVLLAGDAAHQMPPFAGQGMCSGLRDAANLAWKLDLVLTGTSSPDLLDAYEVERTDNVRAVIDFSMELGRVICITDPAEAAERDTLMAGGVDGDAVAAPPPLPGVTGGLVHDGDPLHGLLFAQGRVTDPDGDGDGDGDHGRRSCSTTWRAPAGGWSRSIRPSPRRSPTSWRPGSPPWAARW